MKLCIDCHHYRDNGEHHIALCKRHLYPSPVDGKVIGPEWNCLYERSYPLFLDVLNHMCGSRGRYWKAKELK